MAQSYDAIVVGSGPNGLAASIELARQGRSTLLVEARDTVGGGLRTEEITLPGFRHDICAAAHPMAMSSPFFRGIPLQDYGLTWIHPDLPAAHPFDDGTAAVFDRSYEVTSDSLGRDRLAYRQFASGLLEDWEQTLDELLEPLHVPRRPGALARFGKVGIRSARGLAEDLFRGMHAKGLLAGMAAHSVMSLDQTGSAAMGIVLLLTGHARGWPIARGGSQGIADALAGHAASLGVEIRTGYEVRSLEDLPSSRLKLLDVTPRQVAGLAGNLLSVSYRDRLLKYQYGPGVFKMDWALAGPIPWEAPECRRAGTVHVGGTFDEIAAAEDQVLIGNHPINPFVLLVQPTLFDSSRAPAGKHTAWAYCHVPHGSDFNMAKRIEAQVERFAPGFRDLVLARRTMSPADLEEYNPNYVGGDILGGKTSLRRLLGWNGLGLSPYETPLRDVYLCSASTPPGSGVHGMCGLLAAQRALART